MQSAVILINDCKLQLSIVDFEFQSSNLNSGKKLQGVTIRAFGQFVFMSLQEDNEVRSVGEEGLFLCISIWPVHLCNQFLGPNIPNTKHRHQQCESSQHTTYSPQLRVSYRKNARRESIIMGCQSVSSVWAVGCMCHRISSVWVDY